MQYFLKKAPFILRLSIIVFLIASMLSLIACQAGTRDSDPIVKKTAHCELYELANKDDYRSDNTRNVSANKCD
jgi:hypothetical protein